jgi:hypothetical protein
MSFSANSMILLVYESQRDQEVDDEAQGKNIMVYGNSTAKPVSTS